MEFYDAVTARRTVRNFKKQPVSPDIIRRILSAGLKAPSNDHMRNWEFLLLNDGKVIEEVTKKIPRSTSDKRVDFILKSWGINDLCQRDMYVDAIPKQREMLRQSGCLILPLFYQKKSLLTPKNLSALNSFASIWCCIENILLASAAEGLGCAIRIPLGDETEHIFRTLNIPAEYTLPCYLAVGYPEEAISLPEQMSNTLESKLHLNNW